MIKFIICVAISLPIFLVFAKLFAGWIAHNSKNSLELAEYFCCALIICLPLSLMTALVVTAFVDLFWRF